MEAAVVTCIRFSFSCNPILFVIYVCTFIKLCIESGMQCTAVLLCKRFKASCGF
jgi:hypothetical protein